MMTYLLQTVKSRGEEGTVTNIRTNSLIQAIDENTAQLEGYLGQPLPPSAQPPTDYLGPARMFNPTVRTSLVAGESLLLEVTLLVPGGPDGSQVTVFFRPLGGSVFADVPMSQMAGGRGTFQVTLPVQGEDFEYYVGVVLPGGDKLAWPAGAPTTTQSVIIVPA